MDANASFNVLLLVRNQESAEAIIQAFRGAGVNARAHRVSSESDLCDHLQDQDWDLIVFDNKHPEVSVEYSLKTIQQFHKLIPSILITQDLSDTKLKSSYSKGIDAVIDNTDSAFIQLAQREMQAAKTHRELIQLQSDFSELQMRADQLLTASDEAIAYISDGIIIECNQAFASLFAYEDLDELDCAAIIDLIAKPDQREFKAFLKQLNQDASQQNASIDVQIEKADQSQVAAHFNVSASTLDGEPCLQFSVSSAGAQAAAAPSIDAGTGLLTREQLLEKMSTNAMLANAEGIEMSLIVFSIDDSSALFYDIYLSGMDIVIKDLASYVDEHLNETQLTSRISMDSIALISRLDNETALAEVKALLPQIEKHICELPGKTVQFTCSCAILNLNHKNAAFLLDQSIAATAQIRMESQKNSVAVYRPQVSLSNTVSANDVADISNAIEDEMFTLRYQPLMSLMGEASETYEVQCWLDDASGLSYPDAMINAAQNSELDRWIIVTATKALASRKQASQQTRLIINLTASAIKDPELVNWLGVAIKASEINTDDVIFQFREVDINHNLKSAVDTLNKFKQAGFTISIRDFGMADEPFKVFQHVQFDMARLAEGFIESVEKGEVSSLQTLTTEAKAQSVSTILPKGANANAMATIWSTGCDYLTGDFVQAPQPEMNFEFEF